ncbi:MAG TPA: DUF1697 domain-containing protein [Williamwhitmania sp.]|nr:DUF1697 domain-containing protein [Williamwhitmania sp.]
MLFFVVRIIELECTITMTTYLSILRGINVSGQKMIKMDALRKMFEDLGYTNVQTYIQSGNVIFQTYGAEPHALEKTITEGIHNYFSLDVPVMVLTAKELLQIVDNNPFLNDGSRDIDHLHITMLHERPEASRVELLRQTSFPGEEFILIEGAIYLHCPNGYGRAKLTNGFLEKKLNVTATTRNWKTTSELLRMIKEVA